MSSLARKLVTFCTACALALVASSAWAQQGCQSDNDCPTGFSCEVVGGTDCATPACPPGETCPEPLPCESQTFSACVPGPCSQDSDCGGDLVCVTFTETLCHATSAACAPGEDCTNPEPTEPTCEDRTTSFCGPPYIAPCTADADCGEGFLCKPEQMCSCSGGSGLPPAPGDPTDPSAPDGGGEVPDSECSCDPTGQNYCEAEQRACATAAECPDGWSCESALDVAVPCTFDAQTGESNCLPPVESETYCVPPNWGVWGTPGASYDDAVERATSGEAELSPLPARDSGGCAISSAQGQGAGAAMLLLLLGLLVAVRRRRA